MKLRRPHVVSEGYLRNFAKGKLLRLIDKTDLSCLLVGTKDAFVAKHFLRVVIAGVASDYAEDAFGAVENAALPLIRLCEAGAANDMTIGAVKAAMAMHWARSFSHEEMRTRLHQQVVDAQVAKYPQDPEFVRRYLRQFGRPPEPEDVRQIVVATARELEASRQHHVESMLRYHNQALERFERFHCSLYEVPGGLEFVTSDNPVILGSGPNLMRVGVQNGGLALDEANFIFMPLTRWIGACLTAEPEDSGRLYPLDVIRINQAMWRNAVRRVAAHPDADWARLCNVQSGRVTNPGPA